MDPDPGGPKTCGSSRSWSTTLTLGVKMSMKIRLHIYFKIPGWILILDFTYSPRVRL